MWNSFRSDAPPSLIAGGVTYPAGGGEPNLAYFARPDGPGPFPGLVMVHAASGWDELHQEWARRFANHGYTVIVPNLNSRFGQGTPSELTALARAAGGVSDDQVVADCEAAMTWLKALPSSNGKVGIIGACSGGRNALLTASRVPGFAAVADLWGGGVVADPEQLTANQPVASIDYTASLNVPLLGLFGNDDTGPSPAQVDQHEAVLQQLGKTYMFHRYDGAGHAFFYHDGPRYRPQQAMDGWNKLFDFFGQHLS